MALLRFVHKLQAQEITYHIELTKTHPLFIPATYSVIFVILDVSEVSYMSLISLYLWSVKAFVILYSSIDYNRSRLI